MTLEQFLKQLEDMKYVVLNPRNNTLIVQRKWYDVRKLPYPGIGRVDELAARYRQLWPSGIKSGNLYVRSGIGTLQDKLRLFLKKFPQYTDDEILAATQRYIDESGRDNYEYMKTAEYFIFKNNGSTLETYCELIRDNEPDHFDTGSNVRIG